MSTQSIIATMLTIIGTLIACVAVITVAWIRDRFTDVTNTTDDHDDRILLLEQRADETNEQNDAILKLLESIDERIDSDGNKKQAG